ncbi:PREDICTED: cilia- and flagella-associated protein 161 [Bactrocera latifrons]|uniref:Uncharacterized protein C15orf26 n=1 Tax=Bactrocera latifrons TaxID=174628 RepID=A0A0K8V3C6_BACLA|nr:PREDICTED: cilia- and flagella-associated protein 161 [Bactrocera latifrons]XP_039956658.1 cilia- and flagella-associated protein 161 [Bactrocera tryoni]XP_050324967.1 cilia- and flagella-associated protein 161 [Bactrocera neohumeralis]
MTSMIPTARYRPVVRIGNWFEDICLEQEKVQAFKSLRDRGQLLVEKTRRLFDNFHKAIELEAPKENVYFGAIVQLMPMKMNICEEHVKAQPALSVIINERVVRHSQNINDECEITIAPSVTPCVRNSFRIVSGDEKDRTNEVIKYGQQFRLECVESQDDMLLLYSAPKSADLKSMIYTTFDSRKWGEINLPLGLCRKSNCGPGKEIPSAYTKWFCTHIEPKKRFESHGAPVPSNTALVITHVPTNKNLAAENVVVQTLFGPEFLVSVQNYKDIYNRERWQNIWMICNGQSEGKR